MIKKWSIRAGLVFCCLVWLTAVYNGVPLPAALIRGVFSGVFIFVLIVVFTVGLNALGPKGDNCDSKKSVSDNQRDGGSGAAKSYPSQVESNLIERLRNNPARGAKLISKMTGEGQVKD